MHLSNFADSSLDGAEVEVIDSDLLMHVVGLVCAESKDIDRDSDEHCLPLSAGTGVDQPVLSRLQPQGHSAAEIHLGPLLAE